MTWSTPSFVRLCRRANEQGLVLGVVHGDPDDFADFSRQDDRNERDLHRLAQNCDGSGSEVSACC